MQTKMLEIRDRCTTIAALALENWRNIVDINNEPIFDAVAGSALMVALVAVLVIFLIAAGPQ